MAQSSQHGNSPVVTTPGRPQRVGGNSPPSGSSRPDSWIHADGNARGMHARRVRDGDGVLSDDDDAQVGRDQIDRLPRFPHGGGATLAQSDEVDLTPRGSGRYPAHGHARSRSAGRGPRVHLLCWRRSGWMSTRHPRSQSSWQLRPRGLNKAVLKLGDYFITVSTYCLIFNKEDDFNRKNH